MELNAMSDINLSVSDVHLKLIGRFVDEVSSQTADALTLFFKAASLFTSSRKKLSPETATVSITETNVLYFVYF